jgi:hypothetical protein
MSKRATATPPQKIMRVSAKTKSSSRGKKAAATTKPSMREQLRKHFQSKQRRRPIVQEEESEEEEEEDEEEEDEEDDLIDLDAYDDAEDERRALCGDSSEQLSGDEYDDDYGDFYSTEDQEETASTKEAEAEREEEERIYQTMRKTEKQLAIQRKKQQPSPRQGVKRKAYELTTTTSQEQQQPLQKRGRATTPTGERLLHQFDTLDQAIPLLRREVYQLKEEIKQQMPYQPIALNRLISLLTDLSSPYRHKTLPRTAQQRTHIRTFTGPKDTGQRETIEMLRYCLGMGNDEPYVRQFVRLDGTTFRTAESSERINGQAYRTLVEVLCDACMPVNINMLVNMESQINELEYARRLARIAFDDNRYGVKRPPFLLLFVDSAELMHHSILLCIYELLSKGRLKMRDNSKEFELPPQTELICIFQYNCASKQIGALALHDEKLAHDLVHYEMQQQLLYNDDLIGMLDHHVPFFPINKDQLAQLIRVKFAEFMKDQTILPHKYGVVEYDDAMSYLVEFIISLSGQEQAGMTSTLANIHSAMAPLLLDATARLDRDAAIAAAAAAQLPPQQQPPVPQQKPNLKLFRETFYLNELCDEDGGMPRDVLSTETQLSQRQHPQDDALTDNALRKNLSNLINIIFTDDENLKKLEIYKLRAPLKQINALGIAQGETVINCMIVPLIMHTSLSPVSEEVGKAIEQLQKDHKELKKDYSALKDSTRSLIEALEHQKPGGGNDAIPHKKHSKRLDKLIERNKTLLLANTDDDDDNSSSSDNDGDRVPAHRRLCGPPPVLLPGQRLCPRCEKPRDASAFQRKMTRKTGETYLRDEQFCNSCRSNSNRKRRAGKRAK